MYHKAIFKYFFCVMFLIFISISSICKISGNEKKQKDYGVFLSLDSSDLKKISEYKTVIIDAQYFSKKDIEYLKRKGCTVYSYINIGSIEVFRDYYEKYSGLSLGDYENWNEEKWIDVSSYEWQKFLVSLSKKLSDKNIDGFFVDNCDVYYQYPTEKVFEGLTVILKNLMKHKKTVIINGGDTYVTKYHNRYGSLKDIMTGVNQECVFSKIDFEKKKFTVQEKCDRQYFQKYIEMCKDDELNVYIIEYTKNRKLINKIKSYCEKKSFHYYISSSIELM